MQRFGAWRQASFRRQLLAAFLTIALVPCLLLAVIVQVNSVRERQRLIRQGQAENLQEAITTRNYLAAGARVGRNIVHDLADGPRLITRDP
ncbi:MAG: hypothetical protein H7338_08570, partial [Candidatus Sericytochromatia bacterium]|nr:hypothetical protein [Candidatus Sericytochromatia bacterium]